MPEYIDREKIRPEVCSDCTRHVSLVCQSPEPCYKLLAAFLEAKPVDVAPVVHGRWVFNGICTSCSVCGSNKPTKAHGHKLAKQEIKYCYYCGAKMDGGEKPNE